MNTLKAWVAIVMIFFGLQKVVMAQEVRLGATLREGDTPVGEIVEWGEIKLQTVEENIMAFVEGRVEMKETEFQLFTFTYGAEVMFGGIGGGTKLTQVFTSPAPSDMIFEIYLLFGRPRWAPPRYPSWREEIYR